MEAIGCEALKPKVVMSQPEILQLNCCFSDIEYLYRGISLFRLICLVTDYYNYALFSSPTFACLFAVVTTDN